jgi:hypothetical protein
MVPGVEWTLQDGYTRRGNPAGWFYVRRELCWRVPHVEGTLLDSYTSGGKLGGRLHKWRNIVRWLNRWIDPTGWFHNWRRNLLDGYMSGGKPAGSGRK